MTAKPFPILRDYHKLNVGEKCFVCQDYFSHCDGRFEYLDLGTEKYRLPLVRHLSSGIQFVLIPGGKFEFGLSEANHQAAKAISDPPQYGKEELEPVRKVSIDAFLMSRFPVSSNEFIQLTNEQPTGQLWEDVESPPAFADRSQIRKFMTCMGSGFRLPLEAEWEYMCRGNNSTLFPWGDELLEYRELERWLTIDPRVPNLIQNDFGIGTLFSGEWCDDIYEASRDPSYNFDPEVFVVKGGGSLFWPWQDQEWVWCMPAMRIPSNATMDGKNATFRAVISESDLQLTSPAS